MGTVVIAPPIISKEAIDALDLLAQNNAVEELPAAMGLSKTRVEELLTEIRRCFHQRSVYDAVPLAIRHGIIPNRN